MMYYTGNSWFRLFDRWTVLRRGSGRLGGGGGGGGGGGAGDRSIGWPLVQYW